MLRSSRVSPAEACRAFQLLAVTSSSRSSENKTALLEHEHGVALRIILNSLIPLELRNTRFRYVFYVYEKRDRKVLEALKALELLVSEEPHRQYMKTIMLECGGLRAVLAVLEGCCLEGIEPSILSGRLVEFCCRVLSQLSSSDGDEYKNAVIAAGGITKSFQALRYFYRPDKYGDQQQHERTAADMTTQIFRYPYNHEKGDANEESSARTNNGC